MLSDERYSSRVRRMRRVGRRTLIVAVPCLLLMPLAEGLARGAGVPIPWEIALVPVLASVAGVIVLGCSRRVEWNEIIRRTPLDDDSTPSASRVASNGDRHHRRGTVRGNPG